MSTAVPTLHRVAIDGELWVMATSSGEALQMARMHLGEDLESIVFYVYPFLPKPDRKSVV